MATPCSFLCLCSPSSISTHPKSNSLSSSFISPTHRGGPICTATVRFGFIRRTTVPPPPLLLQGYNKNTSTRAATVSPASVQDAIVPDQQDMTTSTIISALLFIAFIGLSILTIGVVYIAVTDFLQKREGEKFQKEEEKKKKGGGKKRLTMKARAGPKGFGQKIVEVEDDDI